jgi:uncharacterized protein YggU (UPF0235/DUF167 family)
MTRLRLRVSPGAGRAAVAVPRDTLTLVSGHAARDKIVELTGVGPALVERRLTSACRKDSPA